MALNIRPSTSVERRLLFLETLMNMTDKVSKVSDHSVVSALGGGVAKVAGKAEKDIFLAVSQLFPDYASGQTLDQCAQNFGIAPRFKSQGSSTYVRLVGAPGTVYPVGTVQFRSLNGITFNLESDITLPVEGYSYAKISSIETGDKSNVDALSITTITPSPVGHEYVINEVPADGGYDLESDNLFRVRIKEGANILAKGTLAMLEQLFMLINPKVLKVFHHGIDLNGKVVIAIVTQNGSDLTVQELDEILDLSSPFFALTEYKPWGREWYGLTLKNIEYQPIDISFRVDLDLSFNVDEIRKNIQIQIGKYLDFRYFNPLRDVIEWDNILQIVKSTPGVKYVPDQYFHPRIDVPVALDKLPRLRGFLMLNKEGGVIQNLSGSLSPVYYPSKSDLSFQKTILGNV